MEFTDEIYNKEIDLLLAERLTSKELIRLSTEAYVRCMERNGGSHD